MKKTEYRTIFDVCLAATDDIWDDRNAYILAVLKALGIPADGSIDDFRNDYCR